MRHKVALTLRQVWIKLRDSHLAQRRCQLRTDLALEISPLLATWTSVTHHSLNHHHPDVGIQRHPTPPAPLHPILHIQLQPLTHRQSHLPAPLPTARPNMTVVGSTPSCVSEWPGAKLSLPSPSASSSSTGLGTGSRGGGSTPLSRRPPSLAIFTASYPTSPTTSLASSATTSGSSSASAAVSSFILPNAGPSLAARRQHKRAPALGGGKGFVPSLPAALDLTRVPTLEEEVSWHYPNSADTRPDRTPS